MYFLASSFFANRSPRFYGVSTFLVISLTAMLFLVLSLRDDPSPDDPYAEFSDQELLQAARDFYKSRPYFERPHDYSEVPAGLPDLRSETCGQCHAAIYEEWRISTHARAWKDDPQFMEELHKSSGAGNPDSPDVSWMCVNCHTPLINQLDRLVVDLQDGDIGRPIYIDNPYFDAPLQDDAIGCATCHVQDGIILGPRGDSDAAPHPVARGEHLLSEENCLRCHQAEAHFPDQNLACFFSTGNEFRSTEFAADGHTCQSCHMPEVTRPIAIQPGLPERQTRHHWFGGSLIPKQPAFEDEIAPLRPIFGSGATLEVIPDPERTHCPDDQHCLPFAIQITNAYAGHNFPTGDPERHIDVIANLLDASGNVLSTNQLRIGAILEWWPEIKILSDNRLMPGESLYLPVPSPDDDTGSLSDRSDLILEINAHKYRMHQEAFDFHDLEDRYVRGRLFHQSRWRFDQDRPVLVEIHDDFGRRADLQPDELPTLFRTGD